MWPFLALVLLQVPAAPRLEIRGSQIWLLGEGGAVQLTYDHCAKSLPVLSPSSTRIAFAGCPSQVPVIDLSGRTITTLLPGSASALNGACPSILDIAWAGESAVAVTCHINPSLNAYVELDVNSGRIRRELLGYSFTRSPDGLHIAHAGWYPHFSPPWSKSDYLQVDHLVLYPLPAGARPVERKALDPAPVQPRAQGRTWTGIHEFNSGFYWSPDSRRIAFIDCTYSWTLAGADDAAGAEHGRRCSVAAVDLAGRASLLALPELAPEAIGQIRLDWRGPGELAIGGPAPRTLRIP
jgi:hypothetical protein